MCLIKSVQSQTQYCVHYVFLVCFIMNLFVLERDGYDQIRLLFGARLCES